MKESLREIVKLLYDENGPLPVNEIADLTGFTPRYIRQILSEHEEEDEGFYIVNRFRKDVELVITDSQLFRKAMGADDTSVEFRHQVLYYLLNQKDYVRIEDISDHFYVSRTSMDRVIRDLKNEIDRYSLKFVSRPKYGILIEGTEANKRICYAHAVGARTDSSERGKHMQELLYRVLQEYDYRMSDLNFNNLVYHLLITLKRIKENRLIMEPFELKQSYPLQQKIARRLIEEIGNEYGVSIPDSEINYILLHLLGKQMISENTEISEEIMELTREILERIRDTKGIDLTSHFDLTVNLALHLQPLMIRLKYDFKQDNPLFDQIRRDMNLGFDLALTAREVIEEKYGYDVDMQECSYLAMHFSLELSDFEQKQRTERAKENKYLLICATGRGTARILQYKLIQEYGLDSDCIEFGSAVTVHDKDCSAYRCIFSTVAIPFEVNVPVILISPVIDAESSEKIRRFLRQEHLQQKGSLIREDHIIADKVFRSRDELLRDLAERAGEYFESSQQLYEDLIRREEMASTEVGNECCIPHPYSCFPEETIIFVYILKKPLRWQEGKVRFVFFVCPEPDDPERISLIERITALVCDRRLLKRLEKNPTAEELKGCVSL